MVIRDAHDGVNGLVAKGWMTRAENSRFASFHRDRHHQTDERHIEPMTESGGAWLRAAANSGWPVARSSHHRNVNTPSRTS
jgi:hypothetical protein